MSRYSDVWIVLSLASIAGWQNWDHIEPELASAAAVVMQELTPAAPADVEIGEATESTRTVEATETPQATVSTRQQTPQPFGTSWMPGSKPFDCSDAPPGYVIIHDFHSPACGSPVICWGY